MAQLKPGATASAALPCSWRQKLICCGTSTPSSFEIGVSQDARSLYFEADDTAFAVCDEIHFSVVFGAPIAQLVAEIQVCIQRAQLSKQQRLERGAVYLAYCVKGPARPQRSEYADVKEEELWMLHRFACGSFSEDRPAGSSFSPRHAVQREKTALFRGVKYSGSICSLTVGERLT